MASGEHDLQVLHYTITRYRQIFDPFFATKGRNKGTGLGLSQVHGFAKQSGGEIDVSSRIGVGTVFTLYLPIVQRDPDQLSVTRLAGEQRLATRRVLLVEDNESVGQFANGLFEELGQIVTWVLSGEAALELLERLAESSIWSSASLSCPALMAWSSLVRSMNAGLAFVSF
ncbi:ATP-binding protein [Sphingomonas sp. T1]|uniref:ATP-binding protein n=1 Tax=Sphingomonas sp. T1 TaxID=2653172 RepID=UPI001F466B0E|nr:ATP-binding protein [Sphingomonas sp. T1]